MLHQKPKVTLVTLSIANTEYPWPIPRAVKKINIQARESRSVRMATEAGGTLPAAAFWTLKSDTVYYEDSPLEIKLGNLYFNDPSNAGTTIEILTWSEVGA